MASRQLSTKLDYNLAWRFFNEQCFDGELSSAKIHVYKGILYDNRGEPLVGCYHPNSGEILLHTGKMVEAHEGGVLEALYHEMVHQYIDEVYPGNQTVHGALYWEIYNDGLRKLERKGNVPMARNL